MSKRSGEPRQRAEGARYAYSLARGTEIHPDAPRQPVSARAEAVVPTASAVELADQIEQLR
jgi:hypothetical protein